MFVDPEIGVGGAQRAARTRNRAKTIFVFKSARPLGVPAFVIDRRISARLNATACNNTRLATLPRPRTCSLRIALGVKETSYYPYLANLLNAIGKTLKPRVRCIVDPHSI